MKLKRIIAVVVATVALAALTAPTAGAERSALPGICTCDPPIDVS
jgi:hypothetical protein